MNEEVLFPRGSEWRKWDLHIHTPWSHSWNETKRFVYMNTEEEEKVLKEMIDKFEESDVQVFGTMDYWNFDGYLKLTEYIKNKKLQFSKTLLPGMELRIDAPVEFKLNIHVIFSELMTNQELSDFKSTLEIGANKNIKLSDDGLRQFARSLGKAKIEKHGFKVQDINSDDVKAYILGCQTAKITRESLKEAVKNLGKEKCLVYLPFDCSDGIAKLDWEKHPGDQAFFLKFVDMFETRGQKNIDLFLGHKTKDNKKFLGEFIEAIGGKTKPVLSGSDAHRISDYGKPPSEKYTWIKADPNFRGLRQTLIETSRVYIGKIPEKLQKVRSNSTHFVSNVHIEKDAGAKTDQIWFNSDLLINPELVAIIGNKGNGKSALADIIGLLGNSRQQADFSFLNKNKFLSPKDTWEINLLEH